MPQATGEWEVEQRTESETTFQTMTLPTVPPPLPLPRRISAVSSGVMSSLRDQSSDFFAGDYVHNRAVLDTLDVDSTHDDLEDEELIYAATKKFAKANRENPIRAVVSSAEMRDSDELRPSMERSVESMRRDFFRIFKRDDSFLEVSREEIQRVRAMHNRFMEGSVFSFNYNVLLIIASIIAALGLGSNSVATIIASMLVSPLMGPVMGMAYSATIGDLRMFRTAFVTEMLSLLACIAVGAIVSGCMIPFYELPEEWPTQEMESRAEMPNFYIGIPVAFASGLGVAVSVLDEQTSSLVGVAISASLLPPAINAGMLWTTVFFFDAEDHQQKNSEPRHFFVDGSISLGLTLVNILMIIISSMLMFRVKEVSFSSCVLCCVPTQQVSRYCRQHLTAVRTKNELYTQKMKIKKKKIFWTDLGLARKIYQNRALYDNDTQVSNGIRRLGRRVSLAVTGALPFNRSSAYSNNNSSRSESSGRVVPNGSEDPGIIQSPRDRFLSTVTEERISMDTTRSSSGQIEA